MFNEGPLAKTASAFTETLLGMVCHLVTTTAASASAAVGKSYES